MSKGTVVGLFSGIGGLERGFELEGFSTVAMAEIDPACIAVLKKHRPMVPNLGDITELDELPQSDVVVAGFPCQPYSQVGRCDGLERGGAAMRHLLRLIDAARPSTVILENVSFILHLHAGAAVKRIINRLAKSGYSWAYRFVDTRAFGLPQRRMRWILVASRDFDAARALFGRDPEPSGVIGAIAARGFYWTEGTSGIGWADNAVPPLKGGSTVGIPCAPAIWDVCEETIVTPDIRDAERLQGLPINWTRVASEGKYHERMRWRLVGNAVSVPAARWIASGIVNPAAASPGSRDVISADDALPKAAFGWNRRRYCASIPHLTPSHQPILDFLKYEPFPLSYGATRGFRLRYEKSSLRKDREFIVALRNHEKWMLASAP